MRERLQGVHTQTHSSIRVALVSQLFSLPLLNFIMLLVDILLYRLDATHFSNKKEAFFGNN